MKWLNHNDLVIGPFWRIVHPASVCVGSTESPKPIVDSAHGAPKVYAAAASFYDR